MHIYLKKFSHKSNFKYLIIFGFLKILEKKVAKWCNVEIYECI